MKPLFSVIIPCYGQEAYLRRAVDSVLTQQTQEDFEVLIVDDASPGDAQRIAKQYADPRVITLRHEVNKGVSAARNTGIRSSAGEYIVLLDSDDYFHPTKLDRLANCIRREASVDVFYNGRFELDSSDTTIRALHLPPPVTFEDLVKGFPFAPSDMAIRRSTLLDVGLFDESLVHLSEDLDLNCKLGLAHAEFRPIREALNYRHYDAERRFPNAAERFAAAIRVLDRIFADPRCPRSLRRLAPAAYSENHMVWSYFAIRQGDRELGADLLRQGLEVDPSIADGSPSVLARKWSSCSLRDDAADHMAIAARLAEALPADRADIKQDLLALAPRGCLTKGFRNSLWGRDDIAARHWENAKKHGAALDHAGASEFAHTLLTYEEQFGREETDRVFLHVRPQMASCGNGKAADKIRSIIAVNRAMKDYREARFDSARDEAIVALRNSPALLANRGVVSTLVRAAWASY